MSHATQKQVLRWDPCGEINFTMGIAHREIFFLVQIHFQCNMLQKKDWIGGDPPPHSLGMTTTKILRHDFK